MNAYAQLDSVYLSRGHQTCSRASNRKNEGATQRPLIVIRLHWHTHNTNERRLVIGGLSNTNAPVWRAPGGPQLATYTYLERQHAKLENSDGVTEKSFGRMSGSV